MDENSSALSVLAYLHRSVRMTELVKRRLRRESQQPLSEVPRLYSLDVRGDVTDGAFMVTFFGRLGQLLTEGPSPLEIISIVHAAARCETTNLSSDSFNLFPIALNDYEVVIWVVSWVVSERYWLVDEYKYSTKAILWERGTRLFKASPFDRIV